MKTNIITIGRQFGSGGREIAKGLAEKLGVPFYDRDLIVAAAKKSGLSETLFKNADEKATSSFLYSLVLGAYGPIGMPGTAPVTLNETLFQIQSDVIREIAEEGPCVIVGRCADYILRERTDHVSVFLHTGLPHRLERVKKLYHIDDDKAKDLISKTDRQRANFYSYYTGRKWGDLANYHVTLDTSLLGVMKTCDLLYQLVQMR